MKIKEKKELIKINMYYIILLGLHLHCQLQANWIHWTGRCPHTLKSVIFMRKSLKNMYKLSTQTLMAVNKIMPKFLSYIILMN